MWLIGPPILTGENGVSGAWFLLFSGFGHWSMVGKHGTGPSVWLLSVLVTGGFCFSWVLYSFGSHGMIGAERMIGWVSTSE